MSDFKEPPNNADAAPCPMRCSDAFCVGEYVADELEARGWTSADAVASLDGDAAVNELWLDLICCIPVWWKHEIKFRDDEAKRLEQIFGISAQTWININDEFQRRRLQMN